MGRPRSRLIRQDTIIQPLAFERSILIRPEMIILPADTTHSITTSQAKIPLVGLWLSTPTRLEPIIPPAVTRRFIATRPVQIILRSAIWHYQAIRLDIIIPLPDMRPYFTTPQEKIILPPDGAQCMKIPLHPIIRVSVPMRSGATLPG